MNEELYRSNIEIMDIKLNDLIPFQLCTSQMYQGDRLEQLASSIKKDKLLHEIIVRPAENGKYEIICGHNRVNAMRILGYDVIPAKVYSNLSDEDAIALFYDSNLNQQSFADWNYSQKIKAIQYIEKLTKENSQQGKRTDLEHKDAIAKEQGTSVHSRHKLDSKKSATRDKMSRRLGIATATFSKYRRIIKLPDDILETTVRMLDEKKISLEAVYRMTKMCPGKNPDENYDEIRWLLELVDESPDKKIDLTKLKKHIADRKEAGSHTKDAMNHILVKK